MKDLSRHGSAEARLPGGTIFEVGRHRDEGFKDTVLLFVRLVTELDRESDGKFEKQKRCKRVKRMDRNDTAVEALLEPNHLVGAASLNMSPASISLGEQFGRVRRDEGILTGRLL